MPRPNPFPKICVAIGSSDVKAFRDQVQREIRSGESFLEFRLDYLPDPEQGIKLIKNLLDKQPDCTILATCRRSQDRGMFNGSVEEQLRVLDRAVRAGAAAVDVDVETAEVAAQRMESLRERAELIVSYHNFERTPPLEAVLRRLMRTPADAYKLATTARKPSDVGRVLSLLKAHPKTRIIAMAMGETGFPSRVLAPILGSLYTYAAPASGEGTAPGQVSASQLRNLYRIEKLSRPTKIYGIIGQPVGHSISPAVHNRGFKSRRIRAVYVPFLVEPSQLRDFMATAHDLPVSGFSVTIPHKQRIMRYLDTIEPLARRIGAVNTVWRKAGKWRGTNTDVDGITGPLSRRLPIAKASVLLVGNGGAARAAAFGLSDAGARVFIVARNEEWPQTVALAKACRAVPLRREETASRHFEALVHATPLGMFPMVDECFFPDLIPADVVMDMVYNPAETLLLRRAREQGLTLIPGLEMFLEQARRQFEIWTTQPAQLGIMEKAALEALAASH